jgi:hypothetical protein
LPNPTEGQGAGFEKGDAMPQRMKILDLIALIKKLSPLLPLLDMPNWRDAEAVRVWAVKLLQALDGYAAMTETEFDDRLVDFGQAVTGDAQTWAMLYGLLLDLVADEAGATCNDDSRVPLLAEKVGIDPLTIIALINTILDLIKWWRNR